MLKQKHDDVVECIDNDETAAVIAEAVHARTLLLMTGVDGIYANPDDPSTLIRSITAKTPEHLIAKVREMQSHCVGASRPGANGAKSKLEFALKSALSGTHVIIAAICWQKLFPVPLWGWHKMPCLLPYNSYGIIGI